MSYERRKSSAVTNSSNDYRYKHDYSETYRRKESGAVSNVGSTKWADDQISDNEERERERTRQKERDEAMRKREKSPVGNNKKKENSDLSNRNESPRGNNLNDDKRPLSVSSGIQFTEKNIEPVKAVQDIVHTQGSNFRLRVAVTVFSVLTILLIAGLVTFLVLYFGVFVKTPTYKDACSKDKPCNTATNGVNTNLVCDGTCVCDATNYWDGFKCTPLLEFGRTCYGGTFQCMSGLTCINNLCQCLNTSYFDGSKCNSKMTYGSICANCSYTSCPTCISCNQCQDYANLNCNSTYSRCMCPDNTHYFDQSTQLCIAKVGISIYCTRDTECKDISQGLYCQLTYPLGSSCPTQPAINFCNCPLETYYNGSVCKPVETYYATCTQTCECDTGRGLYCDLSDNRCLCRTNYYWSTSLQCTPQLDYGYSCSKSSQCDSSKGLTCISGVCKCGLFGVNWYYSSLARYCVECPNDWVIGAVTGGQKCIKIFDTGLTSWSTSRLACEQHNAHLISLNDSTLLTTIQSNYKVAGSYYIGLTDAKTDGTFLWSYDGATYIEIPPRCGGEWQGTTSEQCVVLNVPSMCLADICCTCSYTLRYICEKVL